MKKTLLYILSYFVLTSSYACKEKTQGPDLDVAYIKTLEVQTPQTTKIEFDNFAKFISLEFPEKTNISNVQIQLTLGEGVSMVEPATSSFSIDLDKTKTITLKHGKENINFRIRYNFVTMPFDPTSQAWVSDKSFGELPSYINVYKYAGADIAGKKLKAYIAVINTKDSKAKLSILGEAQGTKTPSQWYNTSEKPKILINAGYFWDGHSLGLILRDGQTIKPAQPMAWRNYQGVSTIYYPTQGIFGLDASGKYQTHWAWQPGGTTLYIYPAPAPNKAGDTPQAVPSDKFPAGAQEWKPSLAIGAGPILIKNGEYKNLWEYEMFDASSGIAPTSNNPRSAIGYTPTGELIIFACEGRNKTPNVPGLTLKEVADLLLNLTCTEALNLDGGGSTCLLINGQESVIPSENAQRPVTSVLAIY